MGNCASEPKVLKGSDAAPAPVLAKEPDEEVKEANAVVVEENEPENKANDAEEVTQKDSGEEATENVKIDAGDKQQSLGSLLDGGVPEEMKDEKAAQIATNEAVRPEETASEWMKGTATTSEPPVTQINPEAAVDAAAAVAANPKAADSIKPTADDAETFPIIKL